VKVNLSSAYPKVLLILGNDDPRVEENELAEGESLGLWNYIHLRKIEYGDFTVYGYACVPPTPFGLKDWERYDVSRFVDPGCISPEEGWRSVPVSMKSTATIQDDLDILTKDADLQGDFPFPCSSPSNITGPCGMGWENDRHSPSRCPRRQHRHSPLYRKKTTSHHPAWAYP
jgi:hypothetical protein